jgi:2-polyprenyl-6-methoxyphenol hydroxylase-like FAD-dependent oxidoreductase
VNHVLIIGGGIGGLCLAQGLTRAGIRVTVFDRDVDARLRDQGWRVSLKEDGAAALRDCLPPALFDLCRATALLPATTLAVTDHLLNPKFVKPLPPAGGFGMNRLTLREVLLTGLDVRFGRTFTRFEQLPDGNVSAHFADGTTATGDFLVGADGTGSAVRAQLVPDAEHDDLGTMIYGRSPDLPLPDILVGSFNNMTGPGGVSFGVATCRTTEPATRAAARLAPAAELTDIPDYLAWTIRGWPGGATARESVEEFHPAVHRIVEATEDAVTIRLRAAKPMKPWHASKVTLLGDAVHTMPPGRGEGANTALRDAVLLRDLLVELPPETAKARYEAEMLEYSFRVVEQSVREPFFRRIAQGGS